MSNNIIFTNKNAVSKNTFRYPFPNLVEFEEGDKLTMAYNSVPFSWFNVTKAYNNNFFQYKWWDINGDLQIYDVTIDDGYYSIQDLNEYLELIMVKRGHYLKILGNGEHQYFIHLRTNATYYSASIKLKSLGPQMDSGSGLEAYDLYYEAPTSWSLPATFETPEVIIPSNNAFGDLLGFSSGTIKGDTTGATIDGNYIFLSDKTPNMMPSSSVIVTCNLIDNQLSEPNNVLYCFTPHTNYGEPIIRASDLIWSKIRAGKYRYIELKMYDQEFRPLQLLDDAIQITLAIEKK